MQSEIDLKLTRKCTQYNPLDSSMIDPETDDMIYIYTVYITYMFYTHCKYNIVVFDFMCAFG